MMKKTTYVRGGADAFRALRLALVIMVVWLAVSCGNSENGPPTVSWSSEPVG